ncbi:Bacterial regulatory protein, tetR family [compost metagenome]
MRYSASHKEDTRQRLLHSSGAIAKRGGFATAGVDGLMKAVGLTGGAFYKHFSSKDELFAAVVAHELSHSVRMLAGEKGEFSRDKLERCLQRYLNLSHVQHPDKGCLLPSLGAEIARADVSVRETAEHWLVKLQQAWAEVLGSEQSAWALLSQCVGALVVARMVASEETQQAIIEASRTMIVEVLDRTTS